MAHSVSIMKVLAGGGPTAVYSALGDLAELYGGKHYLNYGYWTRDDIGPGEAADEMVRLVGRLAELSAEDEVLDAGCGFGEQDLLWAREHGCRRIVGLDLLPIHVEKGREMASREEAGARVSFEVGDAAALSFPEASFDKIIALECAMHFDSRERFFQGAFRVLRPGGLLVTTDVGYETDHIDRTFVRSRGLRFFPEVAFALLIDRFWQIPKVNKYGMDVYRQLLEASGFRDVRTENITARVYPPFARALRRFLQDRHLPWMDRTLMRWFADVLERYPTYYAVVARKPSAQ
jgi:microcystin synthetase protein McyJ